MCSRLSRRSLPRLLLPRQVAEAVAAGITTPMAAEEGAAVEMMGAVVVVTMAVAVRKDGGLICRTNPDRAPMCNG